MKVRQDLKDSIEDLEMKIVSDKNVSLLARQLALHINVILSRFSHAYPSASRSSKY